MTNASLDLSLVDVSDQLPKLKRNPGMTSWKVLDRECQELHQSDEPQTWGDKKKAMPATMWPNGKETERHLERWFVLDTRCSVIKC